MKERKYKEDWINETRVDDQGRERRVPVYKGSFFALRRGQEKKKLLLSALLPWFAYLVLVILYFRLDFPGARVMYIFLPAALSLFPCLYWAMGIWTLYRMPDRMTRLQKENGIGRVLRSSVGCAIFSSAALIGEIIFLLTGGNTTREWPGVLMLLAADMSALFTLRAFRTVHNQLTEERSEPA